MFRVPDAVQRLFSAALHPGNAVYTTTLSRFAARVIPV
jgi:hypothetical protein